MSIMNLTTLLLVLCVTATAYSLRISQTKSRVTQIRAVAPKSTRQQVITSRTHALAGIAIGLLAGVPQRASAFELFGSASQKAVNEVSSFQKPVYELLSQLRPSNVPNAVGVYSTTQQLKGGKEDSDVVLLYLLNYITPMQKRMEESAGKLGLADAQAQERLELLPKLMQGHMLELRAAIQSMKAEEQRKEVEEVYETLTEFLKLASSKYEVTPYVDVKQVSDKDLYGPFGCGFWGKERAEGSNACIVPPGDAAAAAAATAGSGNNVFKNKFIGDK